MFSWKGFLFRLSIVLYIVLYSVFYFYFFIGYVLPPPVGFEWIPAIIIYFMLGVVLTLVLENIVKIILKFFSWLIFGEYNYILDDIYDWYRGEE